MAYIKLSLGLRIFQKLLCLENQTERHDNQTTASNTSNLLTGPGSTSHVCLASQNTTPVDRSSSPSSISSSALEETVSAMDPDVINIIDWNNEIVHLQTNLSLRMDELKSPAKVYQELLEKRQRKLRRVVTSGSKAKKQLEELEKVKAHTQELYNIAWKVRQDANRRVNWDEGTQTIRCERQGSMRFSLAEFCDCDPCRCSRRSLKVLKHHILSSEEKLAGYRKLLEEGDRLCWSLRADLEPMNFDKMETKKHPETMKFIDAKEKTGLASKGPFTRSNKT